MRQTPDRTLPRDMFVTPAADGPVEERQAGEPDLAPPLAGDSFAWPCLGGCGRRSRLAPDRELYVCWACKT